MVRYQNFEFFGGSQPLVDLWIRPIGVGIENFDKLFIEPPNCFRNWKVFSFGGVGNTEGN